MNLIWIRSCSAWIILVAMLCVLLGAPADASDRLELRGYLKSFSVAYGLPEFETDSRIRDSVVALYNDIPWLGSVNNRLRLQSDYRAASWLRLRAAYDISPRIQDPALLVSDALVDLGITSAPYRYDDFDQRLYPEPGEPVGSFGIYQNLDRLQALVRTDFADIIIGRQAIAWGTARTINPTDFIAPFAYGELDTEDRFGVDAIRVRKPLGLLSEVDAGYVAGKNGSWESSAAYLRTAFHHGDGDFSVIVAGMRGNLMIGGDVAKPIGGAGTWFEAAFVRLDALTDCHSADCPNPDDYMRFTIGADYSFTPQLYCFAEYHYNGAGYDDSRDYIQAYQSAAYTEGGVYLLGRHYFIGGSVYQVTPLTTATMEALFNASDNSIYLAPGLEYNLAENVYLAGGAYVGLGKSPRLESGIFDPTRVSEIIRSEFGSYPDFIYFSFRTYF